MRLALGKKYIVGAAWVGMVRNGISKMSLLGTIFVAAAFSALIFSVLNALGLYSEAAKPFAPSLVALAVIPVFRNVKVPRYVLIFMWL